MVEEKAALILDSQENEEKKPTPTERTPVWAPEGETIQQKSYKQMYM